jgi:uncharacterized protein (TIGR00251 family)
MSELAITVHGDHLLVEIHVVPRASRAAVQGVHDGKLKVALDAPPVDGEANRALVALFAKLLKLKKSDVRLVRGQTSRAKLLALYGASPDAVRALVPKQSA